MKGVGEFVEIMTDCKPILERESRRVENFNDEKAD